MDTSRRSFIAAAGALAAGGCATIVVDGGNAERSASSVGEAREGALIVSPPVLTAVKDGETAGMLHEMATRGVAMAVLLLVVWVAMVAVSTAVERAGAKAKEA